MSKCMSFRALRVSEYRGACEGSRASYKHQKQGQELLWGRCERTPQSAWPGSRPPGCRVQSKTTPNNPQSRNHKPKPETRHPIYIYIYTYTYKHTYIYLETNTYIHIYISFLYRHRLHTATQAGALAMSPGALKNPKLQV